MKNFRGLYSGTLYLFLFLANLSFAGEIDILVKELMRKKVLSPGEVQKILTLSKEYVRKHLAKGESDTAPKWSQRLQLKGDLRLRHQWEHKEGDSYNRIRHRIRFRLKGEAMVTKRVKAEFGLATGGADPRSTNATMENAFETKGIQFDYAYAEYTAPKLVILKGGKMPCKTAMWKISDLLWDSDISLEGANAMLKYKGFFFNAGIYKVDEIKKSAYDPRLMMLQPGYGAKLSDNTSIKFSANINNFQYLKGYAVANLVHCAGTNSSTGGTLDYAYNTTGINAELKLKGFFLPLISVFAETVTNSDPKKNNTGMLAGIKLGDKKVSGKGRWQAKIMTRKLEKDAWVDFLSDSDSYGGDTGIEGNELIFQYGLAKNVILGFDYYKMDNIIPAGGAGTVKTKDLYQIDLLFKF